ncbi:MAG: hypothetical protein AB7F40_08140 [Victivallaceae bacterium]|nr:hypothetical protein [Victivallaceae bacterium]
MRKIFGFVAAALVTLLFCGCQSMFPPSNNHLQPEDLCAHFIADGIPVTQVQPLRTDVFHCERGFSFQIDNKKDQEIGVYKFDIHNTKMREQLEEYKRQGYAMFNALKFQVVVEGSFLLVGVEHNEYRQKILDSLKTFY